MVGSNFSCDTLRKLTFGADRNAALLGIAERYKRSGVYGEYIAGIWTAMFSYALLWFIQEPRKARVAPWLSNHGLASVSSAEILPVHGFVGGPGDHLVDHSEAWIEESEDVRVLLRRRPLSPIDKYYVLRLLTGSLIPALWIGYEHTTGEHASNVRPRL